MPLMFVFSHFYTHNFSLLYMCHLYLSSQGYNQADSEETVCGFIGNVITGQYDEYGYIYLDSDDYAKDNANNSNAATKEGVTIGQIFGLLGSILSCGVLMVWVFFFITGYPARHCGGLIEVEQRQVPARCQGRILVLSWEDLEVGGPTMADKWHNIVSSLGAQKRTFQTASLVTDSSRTNVPDIGGQNRNFFDLMLCGNKNKLMHKFPTAVC